MSAPEQSDLHQSAMNVPSYEMVLPAGCPIGRWETGMSWVAVKIPGLCLIHAYRVNTALLGLTGVISPGSYDGVMVVKNEDGQTIIAIAVGIDASRPLTRAIRSLWWVDRVVVYHRAIGKAIVTDIQPCSGEHIRMILLNDDDYHAQANAIIAMPCYDVRHHVYCYETGFAVPRVQGEVSPDAATRVLLLPEDRRRLFSTTGGTVQVISGQLWDDMSPGLEVALAPPKYRNLPRHLAILTPDAHLHFSFLESDEYEVARYLLTLLFGGPKIDMEPGRRIYCQVVGFPPDWLRRNIDAPIYRIREHS